MTDAFALSGKNILVTGASSGIGKAICEEAAMAGAQLTVVARNAERLGALKDTLATPTQVLAGDLSDPEVIQELVGQTSSLDGLVLCAGKMGLATLTKISDDRIEDMLSINLVSAIRLVRDLYAGKKIKKGASIVFITSVNGGVVGSPANALYGATKGGLTAFARALAIDLGRRNIRVNCIAPGMIETDGIDAVVNQVSAEAIEADKQKYPLRRYGKPADVAHATRYLLSEAAAWVTGTTLVVDGGLTAQ